LKQQFYEILKILNFLKLKITTHSHGTYEGDSATILARVYTHDDGQVRLKHVVISYMKDEISVAFKMVVTHLYKSKNFNTTHFIP
jgi:hypothetical protein